MKTESSQAMLRVVLPLFDRPKWLFLPKGKANLAEKAKARRSATRGVDLTVGGLTLLAPGLRKGSPRRCSAPR